jgi:hypothetical protein
MRPFAGEDFMDVKALLAPAAVLALWTALMVMWLAYSRFSSVAKKKGQLPPTPKGVRGADIDPHLSERAQWASHNFTHLHEQPTIFYAVIGILALSGGVTATTIGLAWTYAGLRIVHSIWQALVNNVPVRFVLFLCSALCLIALAISAVMQTLSFGG